MTESVSPEKATTPELRIPAPEIVTVTTRRIACDGNDAVGLGHPRVWLAIPAEVGFVDCGYCDKRFVLDSNNANGDH
ncbi:zinc-finger domain-containing protein [Paracoccus alkanivorans]|uniref:zinc-finger domain-containing protein n=1 Tax=Paracoccus alkanivorans TaxID=2116655 RepID=UPI0026CB6FC9